MYIYLHVCRTAQTPSDLEDGQESHIFFFKFKSTTYTLPEWVSLCRKSASRLKMEEAKKCGSVDLVDVGKFRSWVAAMCDPKNDKFLRGIVVCAANAKKSSSSSSTANVVDQEGEHVITKK